MTRQRFLHLVSACLHQASVKPWVCEVLLAAGEAARVAPGLQQ